MKKLYIIASLLTLLLASCQVIDTNDRFIQMQEVETADRVVLLMDFTGWQCTNCPEAAKIASGLLDKYPEHLIVVSMHPEGSRFTDPGETGPDFASAEATAYLEAFGGSTSIGLPTGIVDMTKYKGDYFVNHNDWPTAVMKRLQVETQYKIELKVTEENYSASVKCVSGEFGKDLKLLLWLIEDSIVAPQESGGEEYMHRHVFRKCLNGQWGEQVDEDPIEGEIELPGLQGEHFAVVAVLINGNNEVLQCAEAVIGGVTHEEDMYFTLSRDTLGTDTIVDGDTLYSSCFNTDVNAMEFECYFIVGEDADIKLDIEEDRNFLSSEFPVELCLFQCMYDNEDIAQWTVKKMEAGKVYKLSYHVMLEGEQLDESHNFTSTLTFTAGKQTRKMTLVLDYTPSN